LFRNVLNVLRASRRPMTAAVPRKVRLHLEGLVERTCPTTIRKRAAVRGDLPREMGREPETKPRTIYQESPHHAVLLPHAAVRQASLEDS
jgi:hypothetical protein